MTNLVVSFEKKILSLLSLKVDLDSCSCIGIAVSGGADSVSLLLSLNQILPNHIKRIAVTVNHNLREENETSGDASFVQNLCNRLGIECIRYDIPRGKILGMTKSRKTGIEECARKCRYDCFDDFIKKYTIDYLCLAHNQNDAIETTLMRFLQGSSALGGIPVVRGKFVRPLLNTSRNEIEMYLSERNQEYKIDSTNSDNSMLRNSIRNELIPFLNEKFEGWNSGVLGLSKKMGVDQSFIDESADREFSRICLKCDAFQVLLKKEEFEKLHDALKSRIIMICVKNLGADERVSYSFIENCCKGKKTNSSGISFFIKESILILQKAEKSPVVEQGFCKTIECAGNYIIDGLEFQVVQNVDSITLKSEKSAIEISKLRFPFLMRSWNTGDKIENADGMLVSVAKVFENFKIKNQQDKIPLIQSLVPIASDFSQPIVAFWGSCYGDHDWIVFH